MDDPDFSLPRHLKPRKGIGSQARNLGAVRRRAPMRWIRRLPLLGGLRGPRGRHIWRDRRPGKVWSRRLRMIAGVTALLLVVLGGGGFAYVQYFNHRIQRIHGEVVTARDVDSPSTNYLITGVDSREGGNANVGAGDVADAPGYRTDTMMLVHISKNTQKVTIVSFPRDSRVLIPGHGFNKLNAAVPLGGPKLLVDTIQSFAAIHIDHYVQLDFEGFVSMTNALGGVDVCLTEPAQDAKTGINLSAGDHHLNGQVALQYVRQRYNLAGSDFDRIKRQQRFMSSMIRKVNSARTLFDPIRLTKFLNAATGAVQLDSSLDLGDLKSLATKLRSLDPQHVEFDSIPVTGTADMVDEGGIKQNDVLLDDAKILPFFAAIESDAGVDDQTSSAPSASPTSSPTPTGPQPLTVAPGDIHVKVLNGTGITGKAREASDSLASRGFAITGTGNAATEDVVTTVIRYAPEKLDSARTLQAAIPGSQLQISATAGSELTVILGTNYTGTKVVTLGSTTPASPAGTTATSASASPTPSPETAADDICGV